MKRGIIAAPAIIKVRGSGFTMERGLSPQELRYYILYWDKVVIPGTNLVYIELPEEDALIKSGAIERPRVTFQGHFDGKDIANSFAIGQAVTAQRLMDQDKTTDWVIHQIGNELVIPKAFAESKNSLRFELINLLPVPSVTVPIQDILDFKQRRKDELDALHIKIEEVYLEAIKCPDSSFARSKAISDLQDAINNIGTVTKEKWDNPSKFDMKIEFNFDLGAIVKGISGGAAIAYFTNALTIPMGTILGGIASMFRFKATYSQSFTPAGKNSKLSFLSNARDEQIIK